MSNHSTGSLRARLRERTEENQAGVKALVDEQLQRLGDELSQSVDDAKRTIESDIQGLTRDARRWLFRPVLYGILAVLGVAGGSWGLTAWLTADIRTKIERRAILGVEIAEQTETLERIEATTWGVRFHEDERGRFLILPGGVENEPWTWGGGREAVRLRE